MPYLELPTLIPLIVATLLVMLIFAWEATAGQFLKGLVTLMEKVSFFGVNLLQPIIDGIEWLNATVHNAYVQSLEVQEWAWHRFLSVNALAWQYLSEAAAYGLEQTERGFRTVRHNLIPAAIALGIGPLWLEIKAIQALLKDNHISIGRLAHDVATAGESVVTKTVHEAVARVKTVASAGGIAIPLPFPNPWDVIRDIEREASRLRAQLGKYAKILTPAGIVGLVGAAVFSEFGLGSLRCSNNKKLLKGTCGLVPKVLEDLLAGLVAIVGSISLVELAEDYQALFGGVVGEARKFWRYGTSASLGGDPGLGVSNFNGKLKVTNTGLANPGLGDTGL
jgi:hypothetical protein